MFLEKELGMYEYILKRYKNDNREVINYFNKPILSEQFYEDVDALSNFFNSLGIIKGDCVAMCLPNIPNAIMSFYAINKMGAIANIIHPLMPPLGLKKILSDISCKAIFVFDMFYNGIKEILKEFDINVVVCSASDYLPSYQKYPFRLICYPKTIKNKYGVKIFNYEKIKKKYSGKCDVNPNVEGTDIAVYLHSGGTTGKPKTVMLSNWALNACSRNVRVLIGDRVEPKQSMLMVLPLFHVYGLGVCMHTSISAGGRVVLMPQFKPKGACKLIAKQKINFITGVPAMYEKLMKQKSFYGKHLKSLRNCYCGGDKLKPEIKENFDNIMAQYGSSATLCEGYGLTEATICTVNIAEEAKLGSIGKPLKGIKILIVNQKNEPCPIGDYGEICICGEVIMNGYLNDSETTKKVLFTLNGETYVKSGDCGYMDADGYVYYVDRYKRMVKISGINVFPAEIEQTLYKSCEKIDKCCAVEFNINGKSAIKLFVVLKQGFAPSDEMKTEIIEIISERLMKYSIPKEIIFQNDLPLTDIGKVDYNRIQQNEYKGENL